MHSHYWRTVKDLTICDRAATVVLLVRRFRCTDELCKRRIFAERFLNLAVSHAQQTMRMAQVAREVGHSLGGEAGARLLCKLHMSTSPDTELRRLRARMNTAPDVWGDSAENLELSPKVIGVDDWAMQRGRSALQSALHHARQPLGKSLHRALQWLPTRRSAQPLAFC